MIVALLELTRQQILSTESFRAEYKNNVQIKKRAHTKFIDRMTFGRSFSTA